MGCSRTDVFVSQGSMESEEMQVYLAPQPHRQARCAPSLVERSIFEWFRWILLLEQCNVSYCFGAVVLTCAWN